MPSFARNGITEQTKDLDGSSGTTPPSIASETNVTNDTLLGTLRHGYQNLTVASIPLPRMMMLKQNRATVNGALLERNNVLPPLPAPVFTVPGSFTPLPGLPPQNNYNDTLMWQNQFAQTNQTSAQHMTQQEARYLMQQYEEDMLSSRMRILQEQLRLQEQEEERGRLMALLNLQHRHQAPTVAQETWAVPGRWVPNNGDERYNDPGFLDAILLAQRNARNNGTDIKLGIRGAKYRPTQHFCSEGCQRGRQPFNEARHSSRLIVSEGCSQKGSGFMAGRRKHASWLWSQERFVTLPFEHAYPTKMERIMCPSENGARIFCALEALGEELYCEKP
eukprot:scaffold1889_cov198-Amphora_coffeaeformis.AAC.6